MKPINTYFATNGKCYKCNSDSGADCGYSWLWSSGFSAGNVGWWYREVACGEGNINDEEEFCPEVLSLDNDIGNSILKKPSVDKDDEMYSEFPWYAKNYLYDALGRMTHDDRKTRRHLFNKDFFMIIFPTCRFC